MDIIHKNNNRRLNWLATITAVLIVIGIGFYYNMSPKKKAPPVSYGAGFVFQEKQAQAFQVQLTDDMLLEYKLTPRWDIEGKIQYSMDLNLFYWNKELERYSMYPSTVPPQEIINELNKLPVKPFSHEVK